MYNNENSYRAAEPECLVSLREITATVSTILAVSCRWRLFKKEINLHLKFCFECTLVFVFILVHQVFLVYITVSVTEDAGIFLPVFISLTNVSARSSSNPHPSFR